MYCMHSPNLKEDSVKIQNTSKKNEDQKKMNRIKKTKLIKFLNFSQCIWIFQKFKAITFKLVIQWTRRNWKIENDFCYQVVDKFLELLCKMNILEIFYVVNFF